MKKISYLLVLTMLLIVTAVTGCGGVKDETAEPVNLTVSAAASLKDAAEEIKVSYEKLHPEVVISYNSAASGTLQKQIQEGAPVDLFISAGKSQMDALAEKDLIIESSRRDLLGNDLVLITGTDSKIAGFDDLVSQEVSKISIGVPETVPAGKYAKEALTNLEIFDIIQPKLVLANNVRQVLTYVETGNVDAGLVYRSDTTIAENIKIVAEAPADTHKPIVYPMAIIKSTKHLEQAEEFAAFLTGQEATEIFNEYGFKPINK